MSDTRYRDAEWLEEQYYANGLTLSGIANKCGVSQKTVLTWMKKHDIERRNRGGTSSDARHKDAEWLHEQYHGNGLSQREIADKCGVSQRTVCTWMNKHDVEARDNLEALSRTGVGISSEYGYEVWQEGSGGDPTRVRVHRLLAVAEYGFDAVCDMEVHHKNGIRWDNRPDNIELLTPSEHTTLHKHEQHEIDDTRYRDEEWLEEQYHGNGLSHYEIADKCGVSDTTVWNWMEKRGIESRDRTEHLHGDKPADQQMEQAEIAAYQD